MILCLMCGQRHCKPRYSPPPRGQVDVRLSDQAAVFLRAMVEHMNHAKTLPAGDEAALQTSAWLEEIEAAVSSAFPRSQRRREDP